MRSRILWAVPVGLLLVGVAVQTALAKGPPQHVRIDGPGLADPLEITEPGELEALGMASLEDFFSSVPDPGALARVYLLTRSYQDGDRMVPFDQVLYAPGPPGDRGYVYYVGIINGWSEYDGKWFRATRIGTQAIEGLLAAAVGGDYHPTEVEAAAGSGAGGFRQALAALPLVSGYGAAALIVSAAAGLLSARAFHRRKPAA